MGIVNKILKGSIIGIVLMAVLLVTPGMANAMQFSEPVVIGKLGSKGGGGPLFQQQALPSSVDRWYYDFQGSTGLVRVYFRDGSGNRFNDYLSRFGAVDSSNNSVAFSFGSFTTFYEMAGDNNLCVYIVVSSDSEGSIDVTVLGTNKQGRFVKYVDHIGFNNAHGGAVPFYSVLDGRKFYNHMGAAKKFKFFVQGDTLIISCGVYGSPERNWRYLLKWDEKAQWFGIAFEKL